MMWPKVAEFFVYAFLFRAIWAARQAVKKRLSDSVPRWSVGANGQ
jgi:hypothetical protein